MTHGMEIHLWMETAKWFPSGSALGSYLILVVKINLEEEKQIINEPKYYKKRAKNNHTIKISCSSLRRIANITIEYYYWMSVEGNSISHVLKGFHHDRKTFSARRKACLKVV